MDENKIIEIIDLRIAKILESTTDALRRMHAEEDTKQLAAATATQKRTKSSDKTHWSQVALVSSRDADQSNIYQILKDAFGFKTFDVRDFSGANVPADKRIFKPQPSLSRVLLEMKHLEVEKLARPVDDLRLVWMLERV